MRRKSLELSLGYIADSIIETKKKRFNENFTTIDEVNIVSQLIQKKLEKTILDVRFTDTFFKRYFNIVNGVITKSNVLSECLKTNILNIELRQIVYDENFIYFALCEIMINKLYNSIEHNCLNCSTECCGNLHASFENPCRRWTYDFKNEAQKILRKKS